MTVFPTSSESDYSLPVTKALLSYEYGCIYNQLIINHTIRCKKQLMI